MTRIISTPCGQISGVPADMDGVVAYKGIRYATAGRWEYPKVVTHWDGVYQAHAYGHCCYQPRAFYDESKLLQKNFFYREFRRGATFSYDEDCLFLNIFAPENGKEGDNLPVILYIHGGNFANGCGHENHYDGPRWVRHGVIGVTINYRLGPMGFVCLPELHEEAGHSGNYGLFDQVAAMQWVHDNIASFGGDPGNITLMGNGSGAMSVTGHCTGPLADGLFHKAVMSSGGGVRKLFSVVSTEEQRYQFWQKVMKYAQCENLEQFRALEPKRLFDAFQNVKKREAGMEMVGGICMDGVALAERPVLVAEEGRQKDIPCMIGSTSQDSMPPIVHAMALDWCKLQHKFGKQPGYCWYFQRKLPGDLRGAWRASDLWYWFGTLKKSWRPWGKKDYEISNQMIGYLTNFARTGNPNGDGLPIWKPVDDSNTQVMHLGDGENRMFQPNLLKLWYTMMTNKAPEE